MAEMTRACAARQELQVCDRVRQQIRRRLAALERARDAIGRDIAHEEALVAMIEQDVAELRLEIRTEESR